MNVPGPAQKIQKRTASVTPEEKNADKFTRKKSGPDR